MSLFEWRSRKAKALIVQALKTARPLILRDVDNHFRGSTEDEVLSGAIVEARLSAQGSQTPPRASEVKRTVFVSACVDAATPGGWRYNGGIKEYNQLVKLLRTKGHEAFVVTFDGTYEPWLIDHQPTISIAEFEERLRTGPEARCLTSWAIADTYLGHVESLYFWDMELFYTDNDHFSALAKYYRTGKIRRTAGISRTIQAWHMAHFNRRCTVLPNLIDLDTWKPDATRRVEGRIGYMEEGPHTKAFVLGVESELVARGCRAEIVRISVDEAACLGLMQTCDVFMNLNAGKDLLWGEGCPRTIIESMAAGCVNVSFDVIGNREVVIENYNGVIVATKTPEALARSVGALLEDRARIETIRNQAQDVLHSCHTFERRWPLIEEFLEL